MSLQNASAGYRTPDVRRVLCDTKPFLLFPAPLYRHVRKLRLAPSTESVFWVHWDEGFRNGSFLSELPLAEVARRALCSISAVTRAYQRLTALGLLRRQDPGRAPDARYRQSTLITEVLLPRAALPELLGGPDRRKRPGPAAKLEASAGSTVSVSEPSPSLAHDAAASPDDRDARALEGSGFTPNQVRAWTRPPRALRKQAAARSKLSPAEQSRYRDFEQGSVSAMTWDATSLLSAEERDILMMPVLLGRLCVVTPAPSSTPISQIPASSAASAGPRKLNPFVRVQLRYRLSQFVPSEDIADRLAEVIWAVETGVLRHRSIHFSINIALKKLREGLWTRPKGMPAGLRYAFDGASEVRTS